MSLSTTDNATVDLATGEVVDLEFRYSPDQARAWMERLQEFRKAILIDQVDYAVIPGTEKPSLLKPGAEKLLLAAGLGFRNDQIHDEYSATHQGVTYQCSIWRGHRDNVIATCDGYAGYDEDRFYVSAAVAEARERANAARYERSINTAKFTEYRAPWNSVIKMCQKRALVGAALNALAASGLFTQDLEDSVAGEAPTLNVATWLLPHLQALSPDEAAEFKTWRTEQELPAPSQMTPEQAALALIQIGVIVASRPSATESQPEADQTGPTGAGAVAEGSEPLPDPAAPFEPENGPQGQARPVVEAHSGNPVMDDTVAAGNALLGDGYPETPVRADMPRPSDLALTIQGRPVEDIPVSEMFGPNDPITQAMPLHAQRWADDVRSDLLNDPVPGEADPAWVHDDGAVTFEMEIPPDNGHRGVSDKEYATRGLSGLIAKLDKAPSAVLVKQLQARGVRVQTDWSDDYLRRFLEAIIVTWADEEDDEDGID